MCGRFGIIHELPELADYFLFEAATVADTFRANPNVAPTTTVLTVRAPAAAASDAAAATAAPNAASFMRWGLVPHWAKPDMLRSRPMFNARSETVHERPTFRASFASRRCVVPASGFYEWTADPDSADGKRIPMWIRHAEASEPIALAGLWSSWDGPDGRLDSCTVVTTAPNALMSPIHDRMPVLIDRGHLGLWLDPDADAEALHQLMQPREWDDMVAERADPSRLRRGSRSSTRGDGGKAQQRLG